MLKKLLILAAAFFLFASAIAGTGVLAYQTYSLPLPPEAWAVGIVYVGRAVPFVLMLMFTIALPQIIRHAVDVFTERKMELESARVLRRQRRQAKYARRRRNKAWAKLRRRRRVQYA